MPRNKGVGAKRKRKAVPSAPNEVTANEDEPEEEEQPCDDDLIEEALDEVEGITIEKLIDVDMMVRIQMFRLSKRECAAVGAREAIDSRFGRPWNKDRNELDSERFRFWFRVWNDAIDDLNWFHEQWGLHYCPGCQEPPTLCCCHVLCRCGRRHLRYAWCQGYSCHLRGWQPSAFVGE